MKNVKNDSNEKQKKTSKTKEVNPVTMNGDSKMRNPVKGLK